MTQVSGSHTVHNTPAPSSSTQRHNDISTPDPSSTTIHYIFFNHFATPASSSTTPSNNLNASPTSTPTTNSIALTIHDADGHTFGPLFLLQCFIIRLKQVHHPSYRQDETRYMLFLRPQLASSTLDRTTTQPPQHVSSILDNLSQPLPQPRRRSAPSSSHYSTNTTRHQLRLLLLTHCYDGLRC
jgi:hypothetical protein